MRVAHCHCSSVQCDRAVCICANAADGELHICGNSTTSEIVKKTVDFAIAHGNGRLSLEWHDLFAKHADRFPLGSDAGVNQRWTNYDDTMRSYRNWLAQLPDEQERRIAYGNAERIYGGEGPGGLVRR